MQSTYDAREWRATAIVAVICAPLAYTIIRRLFYYWRRRGSSEWNSTSTITQEATIRKIGRGDGPWEVIVLYSYRAIDYESGEQTKTFWNESSARAFLTSIENHQLPVRFDPKDPSASELIFS